MAEGWKKDLYDSEPQKKMARIQGTIDVPFKKEKTAEEESFEMDEFMEESSLRYDSDMDSNETALAVDEGNASGTLYEEENMLTRRNQNFEVEHTGENTTLSYCSSSNIRCSQCCVEIHDAFKLHCSKCLKIMLWMEESKTSFGKNCKTEKAKKLH